MNMITERINALRKQNKNAWYFAELQDNSGRVIRVKGYNTWLQVFTINGVDYTFGMDKSVKQFISEIEEALA